MKRASSPSFVLTLPLRLTPRQERMLEDAFLVATRLYNTLLRIGLDITDDLRSDPDWAAARAMPRATKDERKARARAFGAVRVRHGFTEARFHAAVAAHKAAGGLMGRIGAHVAQKVATRVFDAIEAMILGRRGRPRFKSCRRLLRSLEEKMHATGFRFDAGTRAAVYRGTRIKALVPDLARDEWLALALQGETKFCRILRRRHRAGWRYMVQLVQKGLPPVKPKLQDNLAPAGSRGGFDLGPRTVAWVTETDAGKGPFCPEVADITRRIRTIQRSIERKRRANNPENYDDAGRVRPGRRAWTVSRNQQDTELQLAGLHARQAALRRQSQGLLSTDLMMKAREWRDDDVSLKWLQKTYGKSICAHAPGMFVAALARKAERAGASRRPQNARILRTSQYDHTTGNDRKKALKERWHVFGDGRGAVDRDVYSAFLACHAVAVEADDPRDGWRHDPVLLEEAWVRLEPILTERGLFRRDRGWTAPHAAPMT